ncbi:ATP-binding protein [Rhizobium leguminosarum]|uniref:ATP-binding protein n=1 Tax=Rhizobium leguminosarum TaxID=384 RepID=UPI0013B7808D|nr:ATP-binding protein [Rhizobium leguminosarum]MBY5385215.1 AAA family ATPase [Rhizobium leguminosarum]NEH73973.1 AAA family ATPase [Rhizobium leguminosarum]
MFGVSGAGKTTACAKLAQRHHAFHHISASQLVDRADVSPDRSIVQASATQTEIVERLRYVMENEARRVLLDGHCVIRLATGLFPVPNEFLVALSPARIILIEAEPETVWNRRNQSELTTKVAKLEEIAEELWLTRKTCVAYHRNLSIPLKVLNSGASDLADELFSCLT